MPPRPVPWWQQLLHDSPYWRLSFSILLVSALSIVLARWLSRPIRAISRAARQLGDGDLSARTPVSRGELGQLGRDFNTMADKLAESVTGQQRLLADVSHELRSPLTRLKLAAGLMGERDGRNTYLDRIEKECETLESLVERILTLSRLEGSLYQEAPQALDLAEQIQTTLQDWRFAHPETRIDYRGPARFTTAIQPRLLQHVLDNLLSNACRHGSQVELSLDASAEHWSIRVCDNGPGLPDGDPQTLFEPFCRGDPARSHGGHIGLGLAIARAAAEAQKASLTAQPADSGGLCFCLHKG